MFENRVELKRLGLLSIEPIRRHPSFSKTDYRHSYFKSYAYRPVLQGFRRP